MADAEAMAAIRSNPTEAIATLTQAFNQGMQQRQAIQPVYSPPAPMGGQGFGNGTLDQMMALITQPNMPEATAQILQQDASMFRDLALAGGDFNPYAPIGA